MPIHHMISFQELRLWCFKVRDFPLNAIRQQIASGIDIIVQLGRLRDKSRRVLEISEVDGFMDGEIVLHTLYRFEGNRCFGQWEGYRAFKESRDTLSHRQAYGSRA